MSEPRNTRQRRAIQEVLADSDDFRSAQRLHALLKARGEAIGLATVYRALGRMAEAGELDALMGPEGETLYRLCSREHHHHLVCRSCGQTVEVQGPSVERWANDVARSNGFTDVSHTLEIFGLCPNCR